MAAPEFIYLNEQAVRVTSWKQDAGTDTIAFVVIARGETDRDQLLDLFSREPVMVRIGNGSAIPMDVRSLDTRSTGEGPQSIHRLEVSMWPEGSVPPPAHDEKADGESATLEDKLNEIIALLTEIRDELRRIP